MPLEWNKIISAGVGPIIVISACGLLCLALYNRLAAIVSRLRSFQRERLHEQATLLNDNDLADRALREEILANLEKQTAAVLRRARLIRASLQCLLGCISALAVCSIFLGLGIVWPSLLPPAAILFVVGLLLLLAGVLLASMELHAALDPVHFESVFVTTLQEGAEH